MDIRGFITSGILELYVNGLASPEEVKEVEELAAQYPEIQQEIDAIREAMEQYALAHQVQPPTGLKEKIMGRLEGAPKPRPKSKTPAAPTVSNAYDRAESTTVSRASVAVWLLALGMIAASVAAYLFFDQNKKSQEELKAAQAQFEQYKKDCEERQKQADTLNEQFIAIRHQATRPVQMKGTKLAEDAVAVVYWNNVRRTSYLDVVNLPVPPAGKQYQLWAIVDGKPADMGVFEVKTGSNDLQSVPFIENPQAFAVTLEPQGGSAAPTLDQMYVVGNVGKG
jgi:anti-sigma-K factor RskA